MRLRDWSFALALIVTAAPALAAPATPEEAQRLQGVFQRYIGGTAANGGVTVVPEGESYRTSFDLKRLLSFASAMGFDITSAPLVAVLTPQPDGQYRVKVDGLPKVEVTKDKQQFSFAIDGYALDGLYDPKLSAFTQATSHSAGSTTHTVGEKGTSDVKVTQDATGRYTAKDAGGGTVDATTVSEIKDLRYAVTEPVPAGGGQPPQTISMSAAVGSGATTMTINKLRNAALNDLWVFVVAHPGKDQLVAAQPELKSKLKAALPLVDSLVGDFALADIKVGTPFGEFGLANAGSHYELRGTGRPDEVASLFRYAGLALPAGIVPRWAAPLVPASLELSQIYGPVNFTELATTAIDATDLGKKDPFDESVFEALAARVSKTFVLTLAPSVATTPTMTLKFEGSLKADGPTGQATVTADGLLRTMNEVRAAAGRDPQAAQALQALGVAQIYGEAKGADAFVWRISADADGNVLINDKPFPPQSAPKPAPRGQARPTPKGNSMDKN